MSRYLKKTLALALLLIFAGAAFAEDTTPSNVQLLDQFFAAIKRANASADVTNGTPAASEDAQPAPAASTNSENVPTISDDVPPEPTAPIVSSDLPPEPISPPASVDVPPVPVAPQISEDVPPAPDVPAISEDVPPAADVPAVSADVPPAQMKTVDGGYFTISVPEDWSVRRHSDLLTFVSPSGEARLSVAKVSANERGLHEFALARCEQAGGRDLKTDESSASYNYTSPGGVEQHARIYALPGREGTFAVTSGRAGEEETQILDTLRVKEEAPPAAVKPPEAAPPAKPDKTPPKRAPRAPKEPVGRLKTLNGSHWAIQVPQSWTMRASGARTTISAPKRASTIVVGARLSTHGVPLSEIALAQCRRHGGTDFARLGRGVCAYTTFEGGRRTHVRLYPVGAAQMVQVQITGRVTNDVLRALESLYLW